MDKKSVMDSLAKFGILENELAKKMGMELSELKDAIGSDDIPDDVLKEIEKAVGQKIFYLDESTIIGDNNKNNNDSILMLKMLEAIERKDKQIDRLISIIESKTK